jgi:hypothetical protein
LNKFQKGKGNIIKKIWLKWALKSSDPIVKYSRNSAWDKKEEAVLNYLYFYSYNPNYIDSSSVETSKWAQTSLVATGTL